MKSKKELISKQLSLPLNHDETDMNEIRADLLKLLEMVESL